MRFLVLLLLLVCAIPSIALAAQADLSWTNAGNTAVRVERRTGDDTQPWAVQTTLPVGATAYSQSGLALNTRYCYRPVAFNAFGDAPQPWPEVCSEGNTPSNVGGVILIIRP